MKGETLVVLACITLVQITTTGASDYSAENCPICFNPKLNTPAECIGEGGDLYSTKACDNGEMCIIGKLPDTIPEGLKDNLYDEKNRAMYWCGDYSSMNSMVRFEIGGRDIEATTAPAGVSSSATSAVPIVTDTDVTTKPADPTKTSSETDPASTCEAGSFTSGEGCEACPQDTYSEAEGATECTQCSDGKITLGTGSDSAETCLEPCGPGTKLKKKIGDDGEHCKACDVHTYSTGTHNTECVPCEAGTRAEEPGSTSCEAFTCDAGNKMDGRFCSLCPAGTYMDENGHTAVECKECEGNTDTGSTECIDNTTEDGEVIDNTAVEGKVEGKEEGNAGSKASESISMLLGLVSIMVLKF